MYIRMPTILVISKLTVLDKLHHSIITSKKLQCGFFTQILIYTVIMSH